MKHSRIAALVAAALVFGLVAGGVVTGGAVPTADSTSTAPSMGLKLGTAMRDAGGRLADIVAKLTNQPVETIVEERKAGSSFADIAKKYDVDSAAVAAEAMKVREQMLDARVAAGQLTQERADTMLERMQERVTDRVTSTDADCDGAGGGRRAADGSGAGAGGGGRGGGMQRGLRDGSGGGACGGACGQAPTATQ